MRSTARELVDWIRPDQRLLLRAALMEDGPAHAAWLGWREAVNFDDVDGDSQRLLPLLARRFEGEVMTDPVWSLVKGIYRQAWVANQLLARDAGVVVDALHERGMPVIVLKGGSMVPYLGGDWGARPMYDVDLLVPTDRMDDACAVLAESGWAPQLEHTTDWLRWRAVRRRHSWGFDRAPDGHLDLHWHALHGSLGPRADDGFWETAQPLEIGLTTALALAPADLLLHLLDHGTRGAGVSRVQWVADATVVLRADDPAAIAARLASQARAHGLVMMARECLLAISEIVEEPAALEVAEGLASARTTVRERLVEVAPRRGARGTISNALTFAARALMRFGGGKTSRRASVAGMISERLDLLLARHPAFTVFYASFGRPAWLASCGRRVMRGMARTPTAAGPLAVSVDIDFADPAVTDRYAGSGWYWCSDGGIASEGREARIVLEVEAEGDLELILDLAATGDAALEVEILVNERVLARNQLALHDPTAVRVRVPRRAARRFRPLEIAIRTPLGSGPMLRRAPLKVRLHRVRVDVASPSTPGARE